ncbi:putative HTH CenpB-type DNA-binding domain, Homeobox-like domain superfamily [Plasmopara halstedii]
MKAPSATEVLALMNAATRPDGTLNPVMQHLLGQMQEQHALMQAQLCVQSQNEQSNTEIKYKASGTSGQPPVIKVEHEHRTTSPVNNSLLVSRPSDIILSPIAIDCTLSSTAPANDPTTSVATPNSSIIKRKSIPLSMKKEAIQWIMGPGKGIPSRAEKHFGALNWDVSASSFRKWWKNRDKILGDLGGKKRISGGGRKPFLENAEEKLLVVVIQERAKKDRVTRKWIAKTAQHMFQRSNATFKASENWVTKFIRRNGLTLKRSYVTYEPQQLNLEQRQNSTTETNAHVSNAGNNAVV